MSFVDRRSGRRRHGLTAGGKLILNRASLHEQVADHLRDLIVRAELKPGTYIRLAQLAERLDVSLTPLREALKILAEEQLVELTPNRATRIAPVTGANTRDLFEVVAGIESLAAELAAARMTDEQLRFLEKRHAEMRLRHEEDARDAYFALNREIHNLIIEFASNPVLNHLRSKVALRAERVRFLAVREGSRRREAMQEHEEIMRAFRDRAPDDARRVWRRHLLNSGADTCRILRLHDADRVGSETGGNEMEVETDALS